MSAAPRLLPDPLPLDADGAGRWFRHPAELRDFPVERRGPVREVWDAAMELNVRDLTILPDRFTDLVLHQSTGLAPRTVQDGLYSLELGPAGCHALVDIERRIREATRAGDAEASARARADLVAFRAAHQDLKDRFRQAAGTMIAIASKGELTDADRARLVELAAERDRIRAEMIARGALIIRHSGPGFLGRRQIEIVRRLAGKKSEAARKSKDGGTPAARGRPARPQPGTNGVIPREYTPEDIAALAARNAAREAAAAALPDELSPEARELIEAARKRREAADRRARRKIELAPGPRDPSAPGAAVQAILEAKQRATAGPAPGSIQAALDRKAEELGFRAVPDPDDTS